MTTSLLTHPFLAACLLGVWPLLAMAGVAKAAEPMLAHNVFFTLNDPSEAAKEKLVAACKKYLSGHPGTVFFAAGTLAKDLQRPVNDRDFDVGLHVVFKTKADHDRYQKAAAHLKFIEENQATWKKVRVFDTYVGQ
ncbi:MAG: Dabb family protein [Thermoguttaceae bacterium]|jgi:hypothetical protein